MRAAGHWRVPMSTIGPNTDPVARAATPLEAGAHDAAGERDGGSGVEPAPVSRVPSSSGASESTLSALLRQELKAGTPFERARDPETAPADLAAIAERTLALEPASPARRHILLALGANPATPPETLARLAESEQPTDELRLLVAANPNTTAETLDRLADRDPTPTETPGWLESAIRRHPRADAKEFRALMRDTAACDPGGRTDPYTSFHGGEREPVDASARGIALRLLIAHNPHTSPATLDRLAGEAAPRTLGQKLLRAAVLRNPSTGAETLERAFEQAAAAQPERGFHFSNEGSFIADVAAHPHTPPAVLDAIASRGDDALLAIRLRAIRNPHMPEQRLRALANDPHAMVRGAVADNPSTPLDTLVALADDPDEGVVGELATNPSCPPELLVRLASRPEPSVRRQALSHAEIPGGVVTAHAGDEDASVRAVVAGRTEDPDVLGRLADDEHPTVREAAAGNPHTPPDALARLAADPWFSTRRLVITNPGTSLETLRRFAAGEIEAKPGPEREAAASLRELARAAIAARAAG
ncbi:MAG: hypothetical protein D6776_06550 [Planctomycetota bacterium]|nr:MAG: hypothetical protein D6776_06550 [Planctomycetota bacterium]